MSREILRQRPRGMLFSRLRARVTARVENVLSRKYCKPTKKKKKITYSSIYDSNITPLLTRIHVLYIL